MSQRSPVPGWIFVKCDTCGSTWKETSRDILSPSHVDCPSHCEHGGDTHVWKELRDGTLPRDASGNLLHPQLEILTRGLGTACSTLLCGGVAVWKRVTGSDWLPASEERKCETCYHRNHHDRSDDWDHKWQPFKKIHHNARAMTPGAIEPPLK